MAADDQLVREMVEQVRDYAIFRTDPSGRVVSWNAGVEEVLGYAEHEFIGIEGRVLFTPEDREAGIPELELATAAAEGSANDDRWMQRKDGRRIWVNGRTTAIRDGSKLVGFAKVMRDRTDLKELETALRESESRFRTLVDAASDAIITIDESSTILFANPAAHRIFGYAPGSLPGQGLAVLMPSDMSARHRVGLDRYVATGERRVDWEATQVTGITSAGARIPLEVSFGESVSEGRRSFTAIIRDITVRQQTEERLRQASRLESIGRLAGGVAHEANNQMLVVLASVDFILGQPNLPLQVAQDAADIRTAAERTATITSQLLAFSRRQVLKPQVIALNSVVTELQAVLRRMLGEQVKLAVDLAAENAMIRADPGQISQVLLNLALNARDAMPRGGTLTLRTQSVELGTEEMAGRTHEAVRPGRYAVLIVEDTGHGMDRETLEHIFEPFFTTKAVGEGTGLGLATVYGIVRQSEGYVWADSRPGEGARFEVMLPLVQKDDAAGDAAQSRPSVGHETVLIAEDESTVRATIARVLRGRGYTVLETSDGREALELARNYAGPLPLALIDVVMPGMHGDEVAERLAELRPETRVVFMSGYTGHEGERLVRISRGSPFLQKPFSPEQLAACVRKTLDSAPS